MRREVMRCIVSCRERRRPDPGSGPGDHRGPPRRGGVDLLQPPGQRGHHRWNSGDHRPPPPGPAALQCSRRPSTSLSPPAGPPQRPLEHFKWWLLIAMFIFSRGKRIQRISYFVYLGLFQNLHGFVQGPLYHMRHRDPLKSGDTWFLQACFYNF